VRAAAPLTVPLAAVIVTLPELTPITVPSVTVATAESLLAHSTCWSEVRFPAASRTVAFKTIVSPAATLGDDGEIVTEAAGPGGGGGGGRMITSVNADRPFTVADTIEIPCANLVTKPVGETETTLPSLDAQTTGWSINRLSFASRTVAAS
jgi:hypothetical protein